MDKNHGNKSEAGQNHALQLSSLSLAGVHKRLDQEIREALSVTEPLIQDKKRRMHTSVLFTYVGKANIRCFCMYLTLSVIV